MKFDMEQSVNSFSMFEPVKSNDGIRGNKKKTRHGLPCSRTWIAKGGGKKELFKPSLVSVIPRYSLLDLLTTSLCSDHRSHNNNTQPVPPGVIHMMDPEPEAELPNLPYLPVRAALPGPVQGVTPRLVYRL